METHFENVNWIKFDILVAYSFPNCGIGNDGKIPWYIPDDLARFRQLTMSGSSSTNNTIHINSVVMGRKTWDSLPKRPLPNRMNIIITKNPELLAQSDPAKMTLYCEFKDLIPTLEKYNNFAVANESGSVVKYWLNNTFIIGGGEIYKAVLDQHSNLIRKIYVTEVYMDKEPKWDAAFPNLIKTPNWGAGEYGLHSSAYGVSKFMKYEDLYYRYFTFVNFADEGKYNKFEYWQNEEECKYLAIMRQIQSQELRADRTGVGTRSVFGKQLEYDLTNTFPMSTTKRMFLRGIFEEFMLYIRGQTDNKILVNKGVHVWDLNTTREFLDARGLTGYEVGDMGSTYGFNFRHFGADYHGCSADYSGQGYDQLAEVIRLIKEDPTSRRMIINLWNPVANSGAALPSCLCMYQFYVRDGKYLDLQIYIRSSDYFLANNWNTCTGALFVHLVCALEGISLVPGKLSVVMGDAHLYEFHASQVDVNVSRTPMPFPKLVIKNRKQNIEDFEFSDLNLIGYRAHPKIDAPMAI
jgi:thymidylate synthase